MAKNLFADALFSVENGLSLYAEDYLHFPVKLLYDQEAIAQIGKKIKDFHIYIIGVAPIVYLEDMGVADGECFFEASIDGKKVRIQTQNPYDFVGVEEHNGEVFFVDANSEKYSTSTEWVVKMFSRAVGGLEFHVKYIGQAFGSDGSRHAFDRLMNHEKLQRISIEGVPDGKRIEVILLKISDGKALISRFSPHPVEGEDTASRIGAGVERLFVEDEAERTTLYEASLISHFKPEFNKVFVNSFPSTNMRVLQDLYNRDFTSIIAEMNFDDFDYALGNENVRFSPTVMVHVDLHDDERRSLFFLNREKK